MSEANASKNDDQVNEAADGVVSTPKRGWLSYWVLLFLQTQNAFNDKAAQFLLVPIGAWLVTQEAGGQWVDKIEYVLAAVIVLPFILFSPLAGWLSDRYSKTLIIRAAAILQLVVLTWIAVAISRHDLLMAVVGFFALSTQSVIFSPAKRGIIKELVGSEKLGFASGLMEITAILSICIGQIITGLWFTARLEVSHDGWGAALLPLKLLTGFSIFALIVSFLIVRVQVLGKRPFSLGMLFEHFGQLSELMRVRSLKLAAIGVAFFWGYAGYINLAAIGIAKKITGGGEQFAAESAWMMLAASIGIVLGGAVASIVCKRKIELGLVPVGGILMVLGTLAMAFAALDSCWMKVWFVVGGAGSALILVPLNAFIQDTCPAEKRGRVLAGIGLLSCLAGLSAVITQLALVALGVPFSFQFVGVAVICVFATRYAAQLLPEDFVRLVTLGAFRMFYRVKVMNAESIPKEGGVLLTPNHVTYIDAFILSVACPRKIRFLMFDGYFKRRWIGDFVRLFNAVPISQTRAKDAMRVAAEALEEGAVVCIFPEGQLARTGGMNEFKRGFEMIARKAKCPVLPAAMDGLWGSIFSYERNRFIYKIPYRCPFRVVVHFGEPIDPRDAQVDVVKAEVAKLRSEAFMQRSLISTPKMLLAQRARVFGDDLKLYEDRLEELSSLPAEEQSMLVANALQVGELNTIGRGQVVMVDWDALDSCRDALVCCFSQYFNLKLVLIHAHTTSDRVAELVSEYEVAQYVGGKRLADILVELHIDTPMYDFSSDALERGSLLPCLAGEGKVIAMSMPHPDAQTATNQHQPGHKDGAWGRLLPGFQLQREGPDLFVSGSSLGDKSLLLKDLDVDPDGMICVRDESSEAEAS